MTTPTQTRVPAANRAIVEGELRRSIKENKRRCDRRGSDAYCRYVVLLRAAPTWDGDPRITVDGETATIATASTVLAVLDAISAPRPDKTYLIVLTTCTDDELGASVLAQTVDRAVRPINLWDLVMRAFGVNRRDPLLHRDDQRWLAEALLDAEPRDGGWRSLGGPIGGPMLLRDTALRRLVAARFGDAVTDGRMDAAALLEWTRDPALVNRFTELRDAEREGLIDWLEQTVGAVARVVFRLYRRGNVADAVPLGLATVELFGGRQPGQRMSDRDSRARGRAEGQFFGGQPPSDADLKVFVESAESLVLRWKDSDRARLTSPVIDRADRILTELDTDLHGGGSRVLDAGLDARLATLADALAKVLPAPAPGDLDRVESALGRVLDHRRRDNRAPEVAAAQAAVRLVRWLAVTEEPPVTVEAGVRRHVRSWGWVDRALAEVFNADTARVRCAQAAYAKLCDAVRARRAGLDQAFARRLAAWSESAASTDELLLAENLLERVARPVAAKKAPLIIVIDGMSAAVAAGLGEQIAAAYPWTEIARQDDGRDGALATVPSITRFSRASLLTGTLTGGGQSEEIAGFSRFWRGRKARLFHKSDLGAGAGAMLSSDVAEAIDETPTIVGAVLNTVDDALDHGPAADVPRWRLDDITYLRPLLNAAWSAQRPVVIVSDHGHVLEHGDGRRVQQAEAARYRTGPAAEGEVTVRGPRVLDGDGSAVTVPWDETIRYGGKRAGYHGGVSPAEMVIPVLVFVPDERRQLPEDWSPLRTDLQAPPWWNGPVTVTVEDTEAGRKPSRQRTEQTDALFEPVSLGRQVVESEQMRVQREFVRNPPDEQALVKLIDGLANALGRLPLTEAAQHAGQPQFRMAGYIAQVGRLLNVDGYPIITTADQQRTVTLDVELLRKQFLEAG